MATEINVGDRAPNFDLTSTEGVVLMLHDEVPRMQVLLFFFDDPSTVADELQVLSKKTTALAEKGIKIMAVSSTPLDELRETQQKLGLAYPLLHDDRALASDYGAGEGNQSVLALVDRNQQLAWIERGPAEVTDSLSSLLSGGSGLRKSTTNYPRSIINRLVDRWVN